MLHYLAIPQWYERTNEATDELGQRIISKLQEQLADCLYVLYEMLSFVDLKNQQQKPVPFWHVSKRTRVKQKEG